MTIVDKLEIRLSQLALLLPVPRRLASAFSVEAFVVDVVSSRDKRLVSDVEFSSLQRKIEVSRRLSAFYTLDIKHREGEEIARPEFALSLCALYLISSALSGDLRALNTALKMLDGVLLEPNMPADPLLADCAQQLVELVRIPDA